MVSCKVKMGVKVTCDENKKEWSREGCGGHCMLEGTKKHREM